MTSLNNIIYEDVAPGYGRVAYLGFSLIIKKDNGYVNATHLCAQSEKKRNFFHWIRLAIAKEVIDDVSSSIHLRMDALTEVPGGLPNELRGTYVHPLLVPVIAQWASPRFRTRVAVILKSEAEREYRLALTQKDDIIHEINKKLDNLQMINENQTLKIDKQSSEIAKLLGYAHNADTKLDTMVSVARTTANDLDLVHDKVDDLRERMVAERVVPALDRDMTHVLGIVQTSATTLVVIRTQVTSYNRALKKLNIKHPGAQTLVEYTPTANSINLLIRFKEYLRAHGIAGVTTRYRTITFGRCVDADALVDIFNTLCRDATHVDEIDEIETRNQDARATLTRVSRISALNVGPRNGARTG